eukprot:4714794-Prymnesium_polylepis.1
MPNGHSSYHWKPCDKEVSCTVCLSTSHIDDHCWVKHGLTAHNLRIKPEVRARFETWHEEFKRGTYTPLPGGPPRGLRQVTNARSALIEFGWDTADYARFVAVELHAERAALALLSNNNRYRQPRCQLHQLE